MNEKYLKLKPNELHNHLVKKLKMHPVAIAQVQADVAAVKEARRVDRIGDTAYRKAWRDLKHPLRVELDNAKVGQRYKSAADPEGDARTEAFAAYIKVMEELWRRFTVPSTRPYQTPRSYAKQLNAQKRGSPITNGGLHWSDWVPTRIKLAITEAFDALPVNAMGRRKIPFQRTIPRPQHMKAKETLLKRTISDQAMIERMWNLNPTEENAEMLMRVTKALRYIESAHPNELLPGTWHGMEVHSNQ